MENYSRLSNAERRPLWMALAHALAATRLASPRMVVMNRLFRQLSPGDALRCRAELRKCKAAARGQREAVVS